MKKKCLQKIAPKSTTLPKERRFSWPVFLFSASSWIVGKLPVLQFSLIFGVLMVVFYALTAGPTYDSILAAYLNYSARLSSLILNGFGVPSFVTGLTIESNQFAFTVQRGCDAIEPSWFFLTAVLAFPARLGRKLLGVIAGVMLLNLINLIRIASLFLIGSYYPGAFNTLHVEIWPAAYILMSILLWIGWIAWTQKDDPASEIRPQSNVAS